MLKGVVNIHRWRHGRGRGDVEPDVTGGVPSGGNQAAEGATTEESDRSSTDSVEKALGADTTFNRVSAWLTAASLQGSLVAASDDVHLDMELAGGSARRSELTAVCPPFHSAEPGAAPVYHNSSKCSAGQRIRPEQLVDGVGVDLSLCEECVSLTLGSWASPSGAGWYARVRE